MRGVLLFKIVGSVALWTSILWADPLGLESAAGRGSLDSFQRIFSPHYATDSQDRIYVVLIEDKDLPLRGDGPAVWPPDYSDYAALLKVLGGTEDFRPAGIFLDILFENVPADTSAVAALCKHAQTVSEHGTPVLFAQLPNFSDGVIPLPRALQHCQAPVKTAAVGWQAEQGLYPFSVTVGGDTLPTAAAALYKIVTSSDADASGNESLSEAANPQLRTIWGAVSPDRTCADYRGDLSAKLGHSAAIFLKGLVPHKGLRKEYDYVQRCSFHSVLSASTIIGMNAEEAEYLAAELHDAIVFIGVDVDGIPDFVDSPVHGRLPGVFMHAMALDNMMTLGPNYLRDAPRLALPFGGFGLGVDIVIQTLLLLALALLLSVRRNDLSALTGGTINFAAQWSTGLAFNIAVYAVFSVIVAFVIFITFKYLHWTPLNYGGLLVAAAAMVFSKNPIQSAPTRH